MDMTLKNKAEAIKFNNFTAAYFGGFTGFGFAVAQYQPFGDKRFCLSAAFGKASQFQKVAQSDVFIVFKINCRFHHLILFNNSDILTWPSERKPPYVLFALSNPITFSFQTAFSCQPCYNTPFIVHADFAMTEPTYIPLRLHTEFSITDGMVRIKKLIAKAQEYGLPALGISDLMNEFGLVKFYKACRGAGIKPIGAADVWIGNPNAPDKPFRAMLIIRNDAGYLRLSELLSPFSSHSGLSSA